MHSVANLVTSQTPLATFFPFKKAPKPYLVSETLRYCHVSARSCSPSARTHLSLSHSLRLLSCSPSARTHLSLSRSLSLCVCSVALPARAHTSLSLAPSLSASAQFLSQRAHTPLSLSLSLSLRLLSCSPSARTHLSLSRSLSLRLLSFSPSARTHLSLCICSVSLQRAAEEQRFNSVKHRYYVASLILHASIAEITAQLLSLSYVYLISSDDSSIIRIFVQINILEGRAGYVLMGRVSVTISYSFRCLTTETVKYTNENSFIENLVSSKYSMWAQRGKQM